jgi:hypothetical protein
MSCIHSDCAYKDARCHICIPEGRLYKSGAKKAHKEKKLDPIGKVSKYQKEGMQLEDRVKDRYNKAMGKMKKASSMARRTPGSGNKWYDPGDVSTPESLFECKERGTITAKGEKQISITKTMLDKIKEEAMGTGRFPALPFAFKGESTIYLVAEFDIYLELLQNISMLKERIDELERGEAGSDN